MHAESAEKSWRNAIAAALSLALAAPAAGAEDRTKLLTRSIYVPVAFSIAPELGEVRLSIAGEEGTFPPEPRVFLFTYFPEHRRILPEIVEIRFHATGRCGGEPPGESFESRFFVTPTAIHGGSGALDFEEEGLRRLLKGRRRDVRVAPKLVRIACPAAKPRPAGGLEDLS